MHHGDTESRPKISVVLVDGSFRLRFAMIESLKRQTFSADDFEVLWIEYYGEIKKKLRDQLVGQKNFRAITLNEKGTYHSSYCFNRGITTAAGELLVIADADVLVEEHFLETIWREHQAMDPLVMYVFRMDEPKRAASPHPSIDQLKKSCILENPENYGGCLTVRKKWLLEINGYEQYEIFRGGAHANGRDIFTRFKNLGLPVKWHPELRLYHPWHPHPPGFDAAYPIQHVVIEHRAKTLDIYPFKGIDPRMDKDIPDSLQRRLADAVQPAGQERAAE